MSTQHPAPGPDDDAPTSGLRWNPHSPGTPPAPGYHPDPTGQAPYGEPRFGHPHYGQPPGSWPPPPGAPGEWNRPTATTAPLAVTSLVLGLAGLPCCSVLVLGPAAIVTGVLAGRQVAGSGERLSGTGLAVAGVVLGAIGTVLAVVFWALLLAGVLDADLSLDVS